MALYEQKQPSDAKVDMDRCRVRIALGNFRSRQCTRMAAVMQNGIGYCKQHDPARERALREHEAEKRQLKLALTTSRMRVERIEREILDYLVTNNEWPMLSIYVGDLRQEKQAWEQARLQLLEHSEK